MKNPLLFMFMIPLVTAFSIPADCNGVCWEASHEVVWTEGESFEMETVAFEEASLPGLSQVALTEQDDISMELISSKDKKETKKDKKETKKEKKEVKKQTKSKKSSQETAKKSKSSSKKTPKATAKKTNSSLSFIHQKNAAPHESSQADYQVPKAGR